MLGETRPEVVINTAAFVRVDDCEEQVERAFGVNAFAVRNLAHACAELNCVLLHVSTDYVFGGEKRTPYNEEDAPNPLNVYGVSKLAGEYFVRNICPKHFVVRSSGLYGVAGSSGKGGNFVEIMIRLAKEGNPIPVVGDQILTPTSTKYLAESLKQLLQTNAFGLYHITSSGECSWYEFAAMIFEITGLEADLRETTSEEYGAKALRPPFSALANHKLMDLGLEMMPPWRVPLYEYLMEKQYAST